MREVSVKHPLLDLTQLLVCNVFESFFRSHHTSAGFFDHSSLSIYCSLCSGDLLGLSAAKANEKLADEQSVLNIFPIIFLRTVLPMFVNTDIRKEMYKGADANVDAQFKKLYIYHMENVSILFADIKVCINFSRSLFSLCSCH